MIPNFESAELSRSVEALSDEERDGLPYGIIKLDARGIVQSYSATEAQESGRKKRPTVGLDFFKEVAPCMASPEMRGRVEAAAARGTVDVEIGWTGDFNDPNRDIRIRVMSALGRRSVVVHESRRNLAGKPMRLIGMLDSPFVRRVAVAMLIAEVPFEHEPLSIFRHMDKFTALSPLLKAPSLIEDDGTALVESGVILDYLDARFPAMAALRPRGLPAFHALGLALIVMEKSVQLYYEHNLRGAGERSQSWEARVRDQLASGLLALEAVTPELWFETAPGHADIAAVCAFAFLRGMLADKVDFALYPRLAAFSARVETLAPFRAAPPQDGVKIGARTALA